MAGDQRLKKFNRLTDHGRRLLRLLKDLEAPEENDGKRLLHAINHMEALKASDNKNKLHEATIAALDLAERYRNKPQPPTTDIEGTVKDLAHLESNAMLLPLHEHEHNHLIDLRTDNGIIYNWRALNPLNKSAPVCELLKSFKDARMRAMGIRNYLGLQTRLTLRSKMPQICKTLMEHAYHIDNDMYRKFPNGIARSWGLRHELIKAMEQLPSPPMPYDLGIERHMMFNERECLRTFRNTPYARKTAPANALAFIH